MPNYLFYAISHYWWFLLPVALVSISTDRRNFKRLSVLSLLFFAGVIVVGLLSGGSCGSGCAEAVAAVPMVLLGAFLYVVALVIKSSQLDKNDHDPAKDAEGEGPTT